MSVLHHDTVQLYASAAEISQNWTRPGSSGNSAQLTSGGRGNAPSIRPAPLGVGVVYQRIDDSRQSVGIHASMRLAGAPSGTRGSALIVAGSAGRLNRFRTGAYSGSSEIPDKASDLLTISVDDSGSLLVEHVVQSSIGSSALNRLVLGGSSSALAQGQLYSIEALIDVSGSMARISVWLDGINIVDAEFPRDRVSGYEDVGVDVIDYVGFGGYSALNPDFSDIVVYDAAETAAPIGPVSVKHYPLDNAAFGLPVDDATTVEIPGAGVDFSMPDSFPVSGPVIGAFLSARTMSSANEEIYSTSYTVTRTFGEDVIFTSDGIPGGGKSVRSYEIEGVVNFADLVELVVTARST